MRKFLIGVGVMRLVVGVAAIPLAPLLYEDGFLLLVLMRPTKEVFLAGGFLVRQGDVNVVLLVLCAIPLSIFGAWVFYLLGREYSKQIAQGDVPGLVGRILNPDRVKTLEKALDKRGPKLILLGRLAVLSSVAVAAAAGAGGLEPKRFFPMDLAGGLLAIAYTVAAGYFLGEAYEEAGPWLTGVAVVAFLGFSYVLGRQLKRS